MSVHDATLTLSETLASSNAMGTVGGDWYSRLIMATVVIKNNTPIVLRDTHAIAVVCAHENNIVSVYSTLYRRLIILVLGRYYLFEIA